MKPILNQKTYYRSKPNCPSCDSELFRDGEDYWCYDCVKIYELHTLNNVKMVKPQSKTAEKNEL